MQMTSTLQGIEYYYNLKNMSIFDDIRLPQGVDKVTLTNTILIEAGELECIYSNGDFLRTAIRTWFERKYNMIDRWIKAANTEYNPLSNYYIRENNSKKLDSSSTNNGTVDRTNSNTRGITESETDSKTKKSKKTGNDTNENSLTSTLTHNVSDETQASESNVLGEQTSTTESKVSAFNSSDYTPNNKNTENNGSRTDSTSSSTTTTKTGTESTSDNGTVKTTFNSQIDDTESNTKENSTSVTDVGSLKDTKSNNATRKVDETFSKDSEGNIGNITNQRLLTEELKLWGSVDIYRDVAEMFVLDFCICIY